MPSLDVTTVLVLAVAALAASAAAAVAGTGAGVLLLPVMAALFGPRDAVPMYAIAQLIGNTSRILLNWRWSRWNVVGWFLVGAVPMAVLGALLFARAGESVLARLLGAVLLLSVLPRRLASYNPAPPSAPWFAPIGGLFALVSALVGSAGPLLAPFYVAFGLVKAGFIATEATGTAVTQIVKLATYACSGVLSSGAVALGLAVGPMMVIGAWWGRRVVERLSPAGFVALVDAWVIAFGLFFMWHG